MFYKSIQEKYQNFVKTLTIGKWMKLTLAIFYIYIFLIPDDVLTRFPTLLPFVQTMESALPAIKGFAKNSKTPEMVRFYYSTLWVIFPIWYLNMRINWELTFFLNPPKNPTSLGEKLKFLCLSLIGIMLAYMAIYILGLNEINEIHQKYTIPSKGEAAGQLLTRHRLGIPIISIGIFALFFLSIEASYRILKISLSHQNKKVNQ